MLFELGRGGMGAAYLARALGAGGFERLVVIKRIRPERVDPRTVERFLREAKLAAAIHHANVVSAQNVGQDDEGPFIVLDYVDGASLEDLLDRALLKQRLIPVEVMLRVGLDVLAGLEAVHTARDAKGTPLNVLHRDVSLQNVVVGRDGVARLLDFGIARSDLGGVTTDQHYLVGKLAYLSPEYLRRETLGPAADVYAMGVTLWLALTGKDMWPGASEAQMVRHIVSDGVPPLTQALQVAPEIASLVARACAAEPQQRFSSARAMAAEIERLGRDRGWLATHHEVAQWLDELAGTDLARQRERIALITSDPVGSEVASSLAEAEPARSRASAGLLTPGRAAALLLVATGLLALTAWALLRPPAVSRPSTLAPPRVEPVPASTPPPLASTPPEPQPAPPVSAPASMAEPRRSGLSARPTQRAAPSGSSQPVRPPNQISKRNPYRD